jgi:hypothetical protein
MTTQVLPINKLLKKVSVLIEDGLNEMLNEFMTNYHEYKATHTHVMNLPAIKKMKLPNKMKTSTRSQKDIIRMLVNKIKEQTHEIATLKEALHNSEEQIEEENISLNITDPVEDIISRASTPDTKVYDSLIETAATNTTENVNAEECCSESGPNDAKPEEDEAETETEEDEEKKEQEEEEEKKEQEEEEEEEEEEKEEGEAGEDEEVFEIEIDDKIYYTNNDTNGIIYEALLNEEVGNKVGYIKDGEPFFY